VAHFDKAIPPGGEGKIQIKVKTKGYQGTIHKSARVYTNDPANNIVKLSIKAVIQVPIYVSSRRVNLYGTEGQVLTKLVEVRAELNKPLELTPGQFNLAEKLTYTIEEIEKGRKFQVRFTNIPGPVQSYHGFLKLKTNYPEKPEITIPITGRFRKKTQVR
jgi:hypothetical protein